MNNDSIITHQTAVHNVRFRFACNSSSMHSLILIPGHALCDDDAACNGDFGWSNWIATSSVVKSMYAHEIIKSNVVSIVHQLYNDDIDYINHDIFDDIVKTLTYSITGDVNDLLMTSSGDCTIDHQSIYGLPTAWDGTTLDRDFALEFLRFIDDPSLVILGGNDNDDNAHPICSRGQAFTLPLGFENAGELVCKKDSVYGFWTLFSRRTGTKVRMSFDDPARCLTPTRASTPELVDIKVTNMCPYASNKTCGTWCYQGSTIDGIHASFERIVAISQALTSMRVFEVAIGGGEPTSHPMFIDMLRVFRSQGIIPNFTTRSLSWMKDKKRCCEIASLAGAFAVSVDSASDIMHVRQALNSADIDMNKASVQHVVGTQPIDTLRDIIETCVECRDHVPSLTLLGFKTTGRGQTGPAHDPHAWIDIVQGIVSTGKYVMLGIDTALAVQHNDELNAMHVPDLMITRNEGAFSMYIDAVSQRCGPSSYCDDADLMQLCCDHAQSIEHDVIKAFNSFTINA